MESTTVSIPGYRISEQLYNGSRTLLYRGYREAESLRVFRGNRERATGNRENSCLKT
jgi:hypothetical protein